MWKNLLCCSVRDVQLLLSAQEACKQISVFVGMFLRRATSSVPCCGLDRVQSVAVSVTYTTGHSVCDLKPILKNNNYICLALYIVDFSLRILTLLS